MDLFGLLIVLLLVGLLTLGIVGMTRGNRVRSCCEPKSSQQKVHEPK